MDQALTYRGTDGNPYRTTRGEVAAFNNGVFPTLPLHMARAVNTAQCWQVVFVWHLENQEHPQMDIEEWYQVLKMFPRLHHFFVKFPFIQARGTYEMFSTVHLHELARNIDKPSYLRDMIVATIKERRREARAQRVQALAAE